VKGFIYVLLIAVPLSVFGQRSSVTANVVNLKSSKVVFTYARFGEKLFCLPREQVDTTFLSGSREVAISNASSPGMKGSLICYQCCVGEKPHTADSCKRDNYDNFGRGKSCGCN